MRRLRLLTTAAFLLAVTAAPSFAQTSRSRVVYRDARKLGGVTSFYLQRPLTDAASLKAMAETRGMENDIRRVLAEGGVGDARLVATDVLGVMKGGFSTQRKGGVCGVETAGEGELVECSFKVGDTLPWMAYRPGAGAGNRTPHVLKNFRWAGDAPFEAFLFRAYSRGRTYTILIPKPCGNLSITETRPELRVTKVAQAEKFTPGSQVAFNITVWNAAPAGSGTATNVRLTDALPTGGGLAWAPVATGGQNCSIAGSTLSCSFGSLAATEFKTVTVVSATPTPFAACQVQQNTASATADNANPAEGRAMSVCVPPVLELTKGPKNGAFQIGAPVSYTMTVKNAAARGGSSATRVVLTDTLPTNGGLEWATATPSSCRITGAALQCDLGTIAAQQSVTVTVTSKPAPFAACVAQPNSARVNADGGITAQDSATLTCAPPQLAVVTTPDGGSFKQGGQAAFTVEVKNVAAAGASPATNVKLADLLPTRGGLTWDAAAASAGTCQLTGEHKSALACDLGSIVAGQAVTVTVTSTLKTPRLACQPQPNSTVRATADGGLTAEDPGSLSCDQSFAFFADGFFGKDRRVRPIDGRQTLAGDAVTANVGPAGGVDFAQCSPLFGFNIGLAKELKNNWELAGTAGLALSVVQADDKVREHEVTLDVEANKYLTRRGGAFVGGGLSMWDLFHSDTVTPSALVHFGLPINNSAVHQMHFVGEGRWLLREAGDLANNYQFWGGLRMKF